MDHRRVIKESRKKRVLLFALIALSAVAFLVCRWSFNQGKAAMLMGGLAVVGLGLYMVVAALFLERIVYGAVGVSLDSTAARAFAFTTGLLVISTAIWII